MWLRVIAVLRILFVVLHTLFWSIPVLLLSFFDPYSERAVRLVRFWAQGNLWVCGIKVRTYGRERLDPKQAYIFMSNHQSNLDILALMVAFAAFPVRWVSKYEVRKVPVLGLCMQRTHQVLVDRQSRTQAVAVIRQVRQLLDAGISVVFFPEGTRSRDGRLLPFKPGGFAVAVETGVPVVPVTVNGSRALLPPGAWQVRGGEIEVVFGEPITINPHLDKKAAREELLVQVRAAIVAHLRTDPLQVAPCVASCVMLPAAPGNPTL